MNLTEIISRFQSLGCTLLYAKALAENDNSKNQIYFGPGFDALNLLPALTVHADETRGNFKAALDFHWLQPSGQLCPAPGTQLILYPQYPEVRLSGFLRGSKGAPVDRLNQRIAGRTLFLGVTPDRKTVGYVALDKNISAEQVDATAAGAIGVFRALDVLSLSGHSDARAQLFAALRSIHEKSWIDSKQLRSDGLLTGCDAPQCGGFTLEAELGIPKNSKSEPDYLGYEVKNHGVTSFNAINSGAPITLMTPEPKMGIYAEQGVEAFIRRFGYIDKTGRDDRLNFGGIYRVGVCHRETRLTLTLNGYDCEAHKITNASGALALVTATGEMAAGWGFGELLSHWTRKHAKAVYVPSMVRKDPRRQYCYGHTVRLAEQTDFLRLLSALAGGEVFYDPAMKLVGASTHTPVKKSRSQFRTKSFNVGSLYERVDTVRLTNA